MLLTGIALTFAVNIGGAVFNWIYNKAGRTTTQIVIFVLALIAALVYQYQAQIPGLWGWLQTGALIFSGAVAIYEVILTYFPTFAGPGNTSTPS